MVALQLIACVLLATILGLALAVSVITFRTFAQIRDAFIVYVSSPGLDDKGSPRPSPLAETIDLAGRSVAARLSQEIIQTFNGQASGVSRGLKSIEADIVNAQMANSGNPLALIAGQLFAKQIKKNPMLGMALSQLNIGGAGAGVPAAAKSNGQSKMGLG